MAHLTGAIGPFFRCHGVRLIGEIGPARSFIFCLSFRVSRLRRLECEAAADKTVKKSKSEVTRNIGPDSL